MSSPVEPQSLDVAIRALGRQERRQILCSVLHAGEDAWVEVDDALDADGDTTVPLTAHHRDLPFLTDHAYVEFDADTGRVRRGPRFAVVEPVVRALEAASDDLAHDWP